MPWRILSRLLPLFSTELTAQILVWKVILRPLLRFICRWKQDDGRWTDLGERWMASWRLRQHWFELKYSTSTRQNAVGLLNRLRFSMEDMRPLLASCAHSPRQRPARRLSPNQSRSAELDDGEASPFSAVKGMYSMLPYWAVSAFLPVFYSVGEQGNCTRSNVLSQTASTT